MLAVYESFVAVAMGRIRSSHAVDDDIGHALLASVAPKSWDRSASCGSIRVALRLDIGSMECGSTGTAVDVGAWSA